MGRFEVARKQKNDDQIGLRMFAIGDFSTLQVCEAAGRIASNGWIFGLAMGGKTKMEIQFGIKWLGQPELQHHGGRQGRARMPFATSPPKLDRRAFAFTPFRLDRW